MRSPRGTSRTVYNSLPIRCARGLSSLTYGLLIRTLLVGNPYRVSKSFIFASTPPFRAFESAAHRFKNSLLIRSRTSPLATATLNGLVFDQLGAVRESVRSFSMSSCGTGVGKKSLVLRRSAKKLEKSAFITKPPRFHYEW